MQLSFLTVFNRDIKKIKDQEIKDNLNCIIAEIEQAKDFRSIKNTKKIKGFEHYYRIKLNTYRIGLSLDNNTIIFVRVLPRKDIYKHFP